MRRFTVYTVPFTFTIVATALDEMAVELEDASAMLGGGILRTMRSVTLPLVMPAIVAVSSCRSSRGMTLFGVPAFLLTPARVSPVVTTSWPSSIRCSRRSSIWRRPTVRRCCG